MNLRQLSVQDEGLVALAGRVPTDWKDAICHYLANRKAAILTALETATLLTREDIRQQVKALDDIAQALGEKAPKAARREQPQDRKSAEVRLAHLARVLTPPGWFEKWGYILEEMAEKATLAILAKENEPENQARLRESRVFLRFLRNVEHRGVMAQQAVGAKYARRTGIAA